MALRGQTLFRKGRSSHKTFFHSDLTLKSIGREIVNAGDRSASSRAYSGTSGQHSNEKTQVSGDEGQGHPFPEEPTNCCMSGCANCVWIKYAEELINSFDGGSGRAREIIMNKVQDPNMKAFLDMELRTLGK